MNLVNNENTVNKAHSIFPPSSAERHLSCTPSLVMENLFPDTTSKAADEGTAAHALGEWKARIMLGLSHPQERPVSEYDCEEMEKHTSSYASFILNTYNRCVAEDDASSVMLERSVDFSSYVEGGFGTADCIIVNNNELNIIDLKYGMTPVSPVDNVQLKIYALGALASEDIEFMYSNIDTINLTIYQPRVYTYDKDGNRKQNISTWSIKKSDLIKWGNIYLRPRALMAFAGAGKCNEGKWCHYCKACSICSLKRDKIIEDVSMLDLQADGRAMSDEDICYVLDKGKSIKDWIDGVSSYALAQAVEGKEYDGFYLKPGKKVRVFVSEQAVADRALKNMIDSNKLYSTSFISVAQLEKLIGKKDFEAEFSDLVEEKQQKPSLAKLESGAKAKKTTSAKAPKPVVEKKEMVTSK